MFTIIVAAIVMFAVGAIWFTVLFGKLWSHLMHRTHEQIEKAKKEGMTGKMVIMFILNLVSAGILYYLETMLGLTLGEFLFILGVIWLGFTLPSLLNAYLWDGKSLKLVAINAGGNLAAFIAGSLVVCLMK